MTIVSTCPRCGKKFYCSKSADCWCHGILLPPETLKEIRRLYDRCLCPGCLKKYADKLA